MEIKILVVEDDEHILNSVKVFLESQDYIVDACAMRWVCCVLAVFGAV